MRKIESETPLPAHPNSELSRLVRAAYFSILGNAVPGRGFIDIFAGTGVIGIRRLSRGASAALLIERDPQLAKGIEAHLRTFRLTRRQNISRRCISRVTWNRPQRDRWAVGSVRADLTDKQS